MSDPMPDPAAPRHRLTALPRQGLIGLVRGYRLLALERHGALRGGALTIGRIGRCHPWCAGGHDPVPDQSHRLFSSFRKTPV
jgi:putative component of membrane protein insertase Oxa1/YidC/SpoIIIJ protein YidD